MTDTLETSSPGGEPGPAPATPSVMGDAAIVFRREFLTRITSGMFLASLAFALVMIVGGVIFFKVTEESSVDTVGVLGNQPSGAVESLPQLADEANFGRIEVKQFDSRDALEEAITSGEIEAGVVDGSELVVKTDDSALPDFLGFVWTSARVGELVTSSELEADQRQALASATAQLPVTELEPDPESGAKAAVGFGLVIMLFLTIQLVGGMLMLSITEEKGNNIVELLLSSMSAKSLLIGKLAANGLVGLIQVVILIGTAIVAVNVADLGDLPTIPSSLLLVALLWFMLGFAFFGVLIAAAASLAPSQEDAQSVMTPVFVILLAGYMASIYVTDNPDGATERIVSLIPFVSPFVMPARFLEGDLPMWEHALAAVIALVTLAATIQLGSRIYTRSVIHTDRKMGWLEAFRAEPIR